MTRSPARLARTIVGDPKWLIGTLIALAGLAVAVLQIQSSGGSSPGGKSIHLGTPTVQPTTYAGWLKSQQLRFLNTPPITLHQPGFIVSSTLAAKGYDGRFRVICTVSDDSAPGLNYSHPPYTIPATAPTTQACWLPLPGRVRDTYTIVVELEDSQDNILQPAQARSVG